MNQRWAVAIVQDFSGGWLLEARSVEEALAIVRGTDARAAEVAPAELLAWAEAQYRRRYLLDPATRFGPQWKRLHGRAG